MSENDYVGSEWKEKREKMGKSIDDVSNALRIGHRYLRGIEEGNFKEWPERVFSTGFIRSYAKYLSLDPTPVLEDYDGKQKKPLQQEERAVPPEWKERGSRKTSYFFMAGAVLLVGGILTFFTMRGTKATAPSQTPAKTENAAPAPVVSDDKTAAGGNVAVNTAAKTNETTKTNDAEKTAPTTVSVSPSVVSEGGAVQPFTGAGPYQLFLEASEHTWLMYSFDGGDPTDVMLFVGEKINIKAEKSITIKIGNAGGVVATLNGQRLAPFGKSGQVREITLGR